jgi:hypothetical protein
VHLALACCGRVFGDACGGSLVLSPLQIDLVPTLSLLGGVPIPFNSLGKLIPRLAYTSQRGSSAGHREDVAYLAGLLATARQVNRYIQEYERVTSAFPKYVISTLTERYQAAVFRAEAAFASRSADETSSGAIGTATTALNEYIADVQDLCSSSWTQFNVPLMSWGCCGLLVTLGLLARSLFLHLQLPAQSTSRRDDVEHFIRCVCVVVLLRLIVLAIPSGPAVDVGSSVSLPSLPWLPQPVLVHLLSPSWFPLAVLLIISVLATDLRKALTCRSLQANFPVSLAAVGLCALRIAGLTSNSFIVEERKVLMYVCTTASLLWMFRCVEHGVPARTVLKWGGGVLLSGRLAYEYAFIQSRSLPSTCLRS